MTLIPDMFQGVSNKTDFIIHCNPIHPFENQIINFCYATLTPIQVTTQIQEFYSFFKH